MEKEFLDAPSLGFKKDYYTEGANEQNNNDNTKSEGEKISINDNIKSMEDILDKKIEYLPSSIVNAYLSPYFGMKNMYENLPEPEEDSKTIPEYSSDIEIDHHPIIVTDDKPSIYPPLFDREDDIYIPTTDPESDPIKIIKENYYYDFIDIYKDYIGKLTINIDSYLKSVFATTFNAKITDYKTDYTTKSVNNKNLSHLTDFIIKSNIMLDQTMRLHSKLFQLDETILHIKNIKVSYGQMLRYYSIEEVPQNTELDITSNVILKESQRVAKKKYMNSLYSLYKYLNSSVILMNESLKSLDKQNKAMIQINLKDKK